MTQYTQQDLQRLAHTNPSLVVQWIKGKTLAEKAAVVRGLGDLDAVAKVLRALSNERGKLLPVLKALLDKDEQVRAQLLPSLARTDPDIVALWVTSGLTRQGDMTPGPTPEQLVNVLLGLGDDAAAE